MDLIFNDLSIHGQFHTISAFRESIRRLMSIRMMARRFDRQLYCHRDVAFAQVTHDHHMRQAVARLRIDEQREVMQWLAKRGPFWDEDREHDPNDLMEHAGDVVTEKAVGEAAFCLLHGVSRSLVSLNPSSWLESPLLVYWHPDDGEPREVRVPNYWDEDELEAALSDAPVPLETWKDLEDAARTRCPDLTFSQDTFEPLRGVPFGKGTAERLLLRLAVLQQYMNCLDESGSRTQEGNRLYQKHFTGDKAWFSDSSDSEKSAFRKDLTFRHPASPGESLFCTWHGKVKTSQLRIHFSWPIRASEPLYVVYVGRKITKR